MLDRAHRVSPQKTLLSFVLAIVLVVGLIPSAAFAEGATEKKEDSSSLLNEEATEAEYDETLQLWKTTKGVTGVKTDERDPATGEENFHDYGAVLGETIPAQVYFKIDEVAQENGQTRKEVSILCFDHGVKEFEVPAEIDGNPVVSVGTVNNGSWLPSPASDYLNAGPGPLERITFVEGNQIKSIGYLGYSHITEISIPSTVETLGDSIFDSCIYLKTVNWNNAKIATIPGEAFWNCSSLDDEVVETLPSSVTTIKHDSFYGCGTEGSQSEEDFGKSYFTDLVIPDTVETIESGAFQHCLFLTSVKIGASVKRIGDGAFAANPYLTELTLPQNVQVIGCALCDKLATTASTLSILNPNIQFTSYEEPCYDEKKDFAVDGKVYYNPFHYGQTIIAYAKKADGSPTMVRQFADWYENVAEDKTYTSSTTGEEKPCYTFLWLDEELKVTGSLPSGAKAFLTQTGATKEIEINDDGSFSVNALANAQASIRVSLQGYYDKEFVRSAEEMTGDWDIGTVALDAFHEVPVDRSVGITAKYRKGTDENGDDTFVSFGSLDQFDVTLKFNDELLEPEKDYQLAGLGAVLSEERAKELHSNLETTKMTCQLSPKEGSKLKVSASQPTSLNTETGVFDVTLPSWGSAEITAVNSSGTRSRVLVFNGTSDSSICIEDNYTDIVWPDNQNDPSWIYSTNQLAPGDYTAVAFLGDVVDFNVRTIAGLNRMGVPYAKQVFHVEDDAQQIITLDVPDFDLSSILQDMNVSSLTGSVKPSQVAVGVEAIMAIDYSFTREQAATIKLELPRNSYSDLVAGTKEADGNYVAGKYASVTDDTVEFSLPDTSKQGTLYISLKPTKAQPYSLPVYLTVGGKTAPAANISFVASDATMELGCDYLASEGNTATVYAEPGSAVAVKIGDVQLGEGTTNELGRCPITFSVPTELASSYLTNDQIKVEAEITKKGTTSNTFAYGTWRDSAQLWQFNITNHGVTQQVISDGKETDEHITITYQLRRKENAYWSFDITVKGNGQETNADDTLLMYVDCEGDFTVPITLSKVSSENGLTRYAGEYVDESYLDLLNREGDKVGTFSKDELLAQEDLFIPKSYRFDMFDLAYKANLDEENLAKQAKKRTEDELNAQLSAMCPIIADYTVSDDTKAILKEGEDGLDGLIKNMQAILDDPAATTEDKAEANEVIKELESYKKELSDPTSYFEDNRFESADGLDNLNYFEAWLFSDDTDFFNDDELENWTPPTDDEIDSLAPDLPEADKAKAKESVKVVNDRISDTIARSKKATSAANKVRKEIAKSAGLDHDLSYYKSLTGVGNAVLKEQAQGTVSISDGKNASGESVVSQTINGLTGTTYVSPLEKSDGLYSGSTSVVSGSKSDGSSRDLTYKATYDGSDFKKGAWTDAAWSAGLDSAGLLTDAIGGAAQRGADAYEMNVVMRQLSLLPVRQQLVLGRSWMKAHLNDACKYEISVGVAKCKATSYAMKALGIGGAAVGVTRATDSYMQSEDAYSMLENDIEIIDKWIAYYEAQNPCDSDCSNCLTALRAEKKAAQKYQEVLKKERNHNRWDLGVGTTTTVLTVVGAFVSFGTYDKAVTGVSLGYDAGSTAIHVARSATLDIRKNAYDKATNYRESVCKGTKKKKNKDESENNGTTNGGGSNSGWYGERSVNAKSILDPSGIVYEGLEDNVVEGATAQVYTKGMFGLGEEVWDAEAYEQINPQITSSDGAFAWDVPTGEYKVKVTKEGYEEASTDWLPVLPIQTGHKISLKSKAAPEVALSKANPDYIELEFSQYMKAKDDLDVSGLDVDHIEWVNPQEASESDGYGMLSKTLRVYPKQELPQGSQIDLCIKGAQNYVGTQLSNGNWQKSLMVEKYPSKLVANYENAVVLQNGESVQVIACVRYGDDSAVSGQKVTAKLESSSIANIEGSSCAEAVTDSEGKAQFSLKGGLAGLTKLTLEAEGTGLAKTIMVRTTNDAAQPSRPVAKIGDVVFDATSPKENSITVPKGAILDLSCATQGATIYYTTDNTCPCKTSEEGGTRMEYTGPITVTESTKYRICAYKEGMSFDDYSERLNIDVTAKEDNTSVEPIVPDVPSNPTTPDNPSSPTSPDNPDSSGTELGQTKAGNTNDTSASATTGDSLFPFAFATLLLSVCAGVVLVALKRRNREI